jgi:hypothetical protein
MGADDDGVGGDHEAPGKHPSRDGHGLLAGDQLAAEIGAHARGEVAVLRRFDDGEADAGSHQKLAPTGAGRRKHDPRMARRLPRCGSRLR